MISCSAFLPIKKCKNNISLLIYACKYLQSKYQEGQSSVLGSLQVPLLYSWAQLIEGKLALTQGLILIWVSLLLCSKPFWDHFLYFFLEHPIIKLSTKRIMLNFSLKAFRSEIRFHTNPWVILTQFWTTQPWGKRGKEKVKWIVKECWTTTPVQTQLQTFWL